MTYDSVRRVAATLCGLDPDALLTVDRNRLDIGLRHYLQRCWELYWWPELMTYERRQFAADWAVGTAYTAGTFVYYPPAQAYYQAVYASTGEAPASGTNYETVNSTYWALAVATPAGSAWTASTGYVQGDCVTAPTDGEVYICRTDHTSGTTWASTNWGRLYAFPRRVLTVETGYTTLGAVRGVWSHDPRTTVTAYELAFRMDATGILVAGDETRVYVENRIRCPEFVGNEYAGGTAYTAGDTVYYTTTGDFYTCIQSHTTPAQAPTVAAYWTKQEFPYVFRQAAAQGAYVYWLRLRGQTEKVASAEEASVWERIRWEIDQIERQQGQNRQMKVVTR